MAQAQWEGKSRGTVLGYKIFVFFIKRLGISAAYLLLRFVALYFVLFSRKGTKAIYYFFRHRMGFSPIKSFYKSYQNNYKFGQTIIDKVAITSGLDDRYTYEFEGVDQIKDLLKKKKGGILISAHVGNFEIADSFFKEIDLNAQINLVTTDRETEAIKDYLASVTKESGLKFILIKEDLSHIFAIHNALSANELICFTGDRFFEGTRFLEEELFNKKAKFPAGPFLLAARLKVPVIFVYVMKETNSHYHLYAKTVTVKARDAQALLKKYTESIEWILGKYPLQWFNYFDFWNDIKNP